MRLHLHRWTYGVGPVDRSVMPVGVWCEFEQMGLRYRWRPECKKCNP